MGAAFKNFLGGDFINEGTLSRRKSVAWMGGKLDRRFF